MSREERSVWEVFSRANMLLIWNDKRPLSIAEWAQSRIKNPAPLIEWHKRYLASKK